MKNSTSDLHDLSYKIILSRPVEDTLLLELTGNWQIHGGLPAVNEVVQAIEAPPQVKSNR